MAYERNGVGAGMKALMDEMPNSLHADVTKYRDFALLRQAALLDVPERTKCDRRAAQLRQEGNRLYLERLYGDALERYNESICFAERDSDQLGMGFANRSAIYCEQGEFEYALANIALAKAHHYPEKLMPKLLAREQSCRAKLDAGQSKGTVPNPRMDVNVNANPKIPFVADGVGMKLYKQFGRGLIAERDFQVGDIILDEKPTLVTNALGYRYTNCANCSTGFNHSLLPCPGCVSYMYCSEECLQRDKRFVHRFECGMAEKLRNAMFCSTIIGPKLFFYGLTLFDDDLQAMMDYCHGETAHGLGNPFDMDFRTKDQLDQFKVLHKAGVHHITILDQVRRVSAAVFYVLFTEHSPLLKRLVTTQAQRDFVLNCFLDYTRKCGALLLDSTESSTVSLVGSIVNHSCDPNAVLTIHGGHIKLAVLRSIAKGEQILASYGPTWWQPKPDYESCYKCKCVVCTKPSWSIKQGTLPPAAVQHDRLITTISCSPEANFADRLNVMQQFLNRYAAFHADVAYGEVLKLYNLMLKGMIQLDLTTGERAKVAASLK
ncbi:SET and MYND domain-containing protein 4 [Culex quinquefasciatus]|uniref:SET and MYND domain-containing protein 4 n=1 Tax=Culex quinquefasciatus TaxID=7176 RepID=UPI0018E3EE17|nr:SET and MYND domain-containing protein 4 [Culex quinquefasciatus]